MLEDAGRGRKNKETQERKLIEEREGRGAREDKENG